MFQLDTNLYSQAAAQRLSDRLGDARMAESQSGMAMNEQKMKAAKVERAVQYLGMATPENWQSIRQTAIAEGLGDEQMIPPAYDKNWIDQTRTAFLAASQNSMPASIQEYSFYNKLGTPQEKQTFMDMKRAQPYINLGDRFLQPSYDGSVRNEFGKGISPDALPSTKGAQEAAKMDVQLEMKPQIEGAVSEAKKTGEAKGEAQGAIEKKIAQAPQLEELLKQAETLLPKASSGLLEATGTAAAGMVGESTDSSKADRQLQVISAALTGNVPRFEGPQGVLDVELYKQAAGDVANTKIPYEDRLAAVQTIRSLNAKYSKAAENPESVAPATGAPQSGMVVDGYRFKGGNPNDPDAWEPAQ